jgi:hypothetical protein
MDAANAALTADAIQVLEVLNQRAQALEILGKASRSFLEGLSRIPDLKELRTDPRFQTLLEESK